MEVEDSSNRSRPRLPLVIITVVVGGFLLTLALDLFQPESRASRKTRITITRVWEGEIANFLKQRLVQSGELTNLDNRSIAQSVFGTNSLHPSRLNTKGELLDIWKTPFQIEIVAPTNFIIRSAGPNRRCGDDDDIVFKSLTNGFVDP